MNVSDRIYNRECDFRFYGEIGGIIPCWQRSPIFSSVVSASIPVQPANIANWTAAQFNDYRELVEPIAAHSELWLKTFIYVPADLDAFLEMEYAFAYDDSKLQLEAFVNGNRVFQPPALLFLTSNLPGLWLRLQQGWNELAIQLQVKQATERLRFSARLIRKNGMIVGPEHFASDKSLTPHFPPPPCRDFPIRYQERVWGESVIKEYPVTVRELTSEQLKNFTPGIGADIKSAGRFGFAKGDGLLDCSMPFLGIITKPYLCGHPDFTKSIMWHFKLLPPGIPEKEQYTGNRPWLVHTSEAMEQLDVNWISVDWRKRFATESDFYHRKSGQAVNFSCSYSIAFPGILVETDDAALRLEGMESAGSYNSILLPLTNGRTIRSHPGDLVYDREKDGEFIDNWILLWGSDSFPDVPIMLMLQKKPEKIIFNRNSDHSLRSIDIVAAKEFGLAAVVFPFGFEVFSPSSAGNDKWLTGAIEKCAFFSKAVMAYPSNCREFFKVDSTLNRIEILQQFNYRIIRDDWGSKPLFIAPLPPPLSLTGDTTQFVVDSAAEDFDFPTKYGYLKGVIGRNWSSYSLPLPPSRRKFCLKPEGDNTIASLISSDFNEYLNFHTATDIIPNPGIYQFILQYALPLELFNFLNENERRQLESLTSEGVKKGVSINTEYRHTSGKHCYSWYKRTEPYTGIDYLMTYLHVYGINDLNSCDRDDIAAHRKTFYEVDWGNGLAIYSLYLGALLSGNWQSIKDNWATIRHAFDYFLVMQDWACMASGYCESGITWSDGTNYGGYVGFVRMAEIIGDTESQNLGMYAFSKLAAMRLAVFRSTQNYFDRFFGVAPWWIGKNFHEETDLGIQFTCVPQLFGRYRMQGIYNMTTEGHYPEAWDWYCRMMPTDVKELLTAVNSSCGEIFEPQDYRQNEYGAYSSYGTHFGEQERFSYLMLALFSGFYPTDKLLSLVKQSADNHLLSENFLGTSFSHRRVPSQWAYCFLQSQIQAGDFPAWLTGWYETRIEKAEYNQQRQIADICLTNSRENSWIEIGTDRIPEKVTIDGEAILLARLHYNNKLLRINVHGIKNIQLFF